MVRRNINVAVRYHEFVISLNLGRFARRASLVLHSAAQPVSLHPRLGLRAPRGW
jgi:hypothetical protein